MTTEITMPRLSETMSDGKIVSWHKHTGDRVNKGDVIAEVETDKANMQIEAVDSGTLSQILIDEGQLARVGQPIAVLNGKVKTAEYQEPAKEQPEQKAKVIREENLPKSKKEEIIEEPVQRKGIPDEFMYSPEIEEHPGPAASKSEALPAKPKEIIKASPLARKLARENNVDISQVNGTGPGGRITERDILDFINMSQKPKAGAQLEKRAEETSKGNFEKLPLSRMRQTIAKRMLDSKKNVPHFYVTYEVNADNLIRFHDAVKEDIDKDVTLNDLFIKATAITLKKYPKFNASFKGDYIEAYQEINIGIAFAVEDGLLVPVVHNCDKKSIKEISEATKAIKEKVKNNKLLPEDMSGGTFSISNMGMFGVKEFQAIINPPESAGLAIGAVIQAPVAKDNQVVIGNVVNLTLSADHRVVDGAEAAVFVRELKQILEDPEQIE